jgi:hypothetical protein
VQRFAKYTYEVLVVYAELHVFRPAQYTYHALEYNCFFVPDFGGHATLGFCWHFVCQPVFLFLVLDVVGDANGYSGVEVAKD